MTNYEKQFVGTWNWHVNSKKIGTITLKSDNKYVLERFNPNPLRRLQNALGGDTIKGSWTASATNWLGNKKPHIRLYFESSDAPAFMQLGVVAVRISDILSNGEALYIKAITDSRITFKEKLFDKAIWYRASI